MKNYFLKLNLRNPISEIRSPKSGFTLIEVMVAVGLFTVVMVIGIGSVLNVNTTYGKTQKMRSLIDNMGFVMEDMTRTIRTGSVYMCGTPNNITVSNGTISGPVPGSPLSPADCPTQTYYYTLTIEPVGGDPNTSDNQIVYVFTTINGVGKIFKSTNGGASYIPLTPDEVDIDLGRSGFIVTGSDPLDTEQARVRINIEGEVKYRDDVTAFALQTTVSSRAQ